MGFSLKRALKGVVRLAKPVIRTALPAAFGLPPWATAGIAAGFSRRPVSMAVPMMTDTGEVVDGNGGMMPTGAPVAAGIMAVAAVVWKLAGRLGIPLQASVSSVTRVGTRIWNSLATFAAKHPGVSLTSLLVGLGLSADEAATFIGWGATKRRRRRARGITARDLRTTRRTVRKVVRISQDLRRLSIGVAGGARARPGTRTSIVQAR